MSLKIGTKFTGVKIKSKANTKATGAVDISSSIKVASSVLNDWRGFVFVRNI